MNTPAHRLRSARQRAGYAAAADFARDNNETETTYRAYENGSRPLTVSAAKRLASKLGLDSWKDLLFEDDVDVDTVEEAEVDASRKAAPRAFRHESETIPEIDVYGGMGGGGEALVHYDPSGPTDRIAAHWQLPAEYLRAEFGVDRVDCRIIRVKGDSMEPLLRSGDRVLINVSDKLPSPPGVFALWDGVGVIVKRLELVPKSDPLSVDVISENPRHSTYQLSAEEINIIGRVIWVARRI